MDELLKGISLIGRSLALWTCVTHIRSHLQQSVTDLTTLQQQILTEVTSGGGGHGTVDLKSISRQLEIQRISCLFLTHLLFEGGDRSTLTGAASANCSISNASGNGVCSSSDISLVPRYIVEPLDHFLLQVTEASSSGPSANSAGRDPSQAAVEAFTSAVRQLRHEMQLLLPLCAHSLGLQQQALEVAKQLRQQLDPRQIASGENVKKQDSCTDAVLFCCVSLSRLAMLCHANVRIAF